MNTNTFHEPIFLSHSAIDKPLVQEFYRRLKRTRARIWFDTFDIIPGELILERVNEGIAGSQILLLFVSENSMKSHWVKYEWTTFITKKLNDRREIYLIPIVIDGVEPPASLQSFRYIKLDRQNPSVAIKETADAIKEVARKIAIDKRGYETLRLFDREKIVDREATVVERHITLRPVRDGPLELDFHQWQTNPGATAIVRTSIVDNNTQEITPSALEIIENTSTSFHLRNRFQSRKGQVVTAMFEVLCKHYHADIFRIGYSQIDFLIRYPIERYSFALEVPKKPAFGGMSVQCRRGLRQVRVIESEAAMDRVFKVDQENLFPMEQLVIVTSDVNHAEGANPQ